jgi:hypothetical protein
MRLLIACVATLAIAGCPSNGDGCAPGTERCIEEPGKYQLCYGGEGFYIWQDHMCDGLSPACTNGPDSKVVCRDTMKPPACPSITESLPGQISSYWRARASADLDGDGRLDLVFVGEDSAVHFALGLDGTTFASPVTVSLPDFQHVSSAQPADVDGDHDVDLVAASDGSPMRLSVFLNDGHAAFVPGMAYSIATPFMLQAVVDLDGDGRDDVVATLPGAPGRVDVLSHLTDATFADVQTMLGTPDDPILFDMTLQPASFLRDGTTTFAALFDWGIDVLSASNDGTFRLGAELFDAIGIGDASGDGLSDVVRKARSIDGADVTGALSGGNGTFGAPITSSVPSGYQLVTVADVDGDRRADLVCLYDAKNLAVFKGHGNGTFASPAPFAAPADWATWSIVRDFDGDGRQDVAVHSASDGIVVFRDACTAK